MEAALAGQGCHTAKASRKTGSCQQDTLGISGLQRSGTKQATGSRAMMKSARGTAELQKA